MPSLIPFGHIPGWGSGSKQKRYPTHLDYYVNMTTKAEVDWAYEQWTTEHGAEPTWGKVEWASLNRAIKRSGTTFRGRWTAYLANTEPFYAGHNPRKFILDLDKWAATAAPLRRQTHDEYGWLRWCGHQRIGTEPDPSCLICQAKAEEE